MTIDRTLEFHARPSVAGYMLRALYPTALRQAPPFPAIRVRWRVSRPDPSRLRSFLELTGLEAGGGLPPLYLQIVTFPLQMVILTDPAMPLPIWRVLQVRNHMVERCRTPADAPLEAVAAVAGQRVLEKGLELDVYVGVTVGGDQVWEGLTTYRYRGRFGEPGRASPFAAAPRVAGGDPLATWRAPPGGGLAFSALSGDYNGIHLSSTYARALGFRGALHHPHLIVGQCLARLLPPAPGQRLDLWLKGPVYYGDRLALDVGRADGGLTFSLTAGGEGRPAVVGRWSSQDPGSSLVAVPDLPLSGPPRDRPCDLADACALRSA